MSSEIVVKRTRVGERELLGGTIESVIPGRSRHYGQEQPAVLIVSVPVRKRGGAIVHKTFHVEVWSDEEGNGAGYLYVEDLERKA